MKYYYGRHDGENKLFFNDGVSYYDLEHRWMMPKSIYGEFEIKPGQLWANNKMIGVVTWTGRDENFHLVVDVKSHTTMCIPITAFLKDWVKLKYPPYSCVQCCTAKIRLDSNAELADDLKCWSCK